MSINPVSIKNTSACRQDQEVGVNNMLSNNLNRIAEIIEAIYRRAQCSTVVHNTRIVMTDEELCEIYRLAKDASSANTRDSLMIKFTEQEIKALQNNPDALRVLADHHDCEEVMADAIEPGCGLFDANRANELRKLATEIEEKQ